MLTVNELTALMGENFINTFYDEIRIIANDGSNDVLQCDGCTMTSCHQKCYHFWGRDHKCKVCVSEQAHNENKTMMKFEYNNFKYYFVIARPIIFQGNNYIVEFITDVTKNLASCSFEGGDSNFICDLIYQLEQANTHDIFTGLHNKTYFENTLTHELEDVNDIIDTSTISDVEISSDSEHKQPLYMAILDINDFKLVNDCYGHDAGDKSILSVASMLKSSIPYNQRTLARFGGDEFCVLFRRGLEEETCINYMENIKQKIAATLQDGEKAHYHVSISYGLKDVSDCDNFHDALQLVDEALYQDKKIKPKFVIEN